MADDLIWDENEVWNEIKSYKDQKSEFLKFKDGVNKLELKSRQGGLFTHYIKNLGTVICKGKDCFFCEKKSKKRREIYYFANLNDEMGLLRLPVSIFINILNLVNEKVYDKVNSPRDAMWIIIKKGEGRETKYTTSFGALVEVNENEVKENTDKVKKFLERYKEKLISRYDEFVSKFNQGKKETVENEEVIPEPTEAENQEEIDPDEIPF
jgi:hypothetical protein